MSASIKRSRYMLDTIDKKNNITITFLGHDQFALQQLHSQAKVNVVIAALNGVVFYRGLSIAVNYDNNSNLIMMKFEPLVRFGLNVIRERRIFQPNCPYRLYGDNCQVKPVLNPLWVVTIIDKKRLRCRFDTHNPDNTSYDVLAVQPTLSRANIGKLLGGYIDDRTRATDPSRGKYWIDDLTDPTLMGQYVYFTVTLLREHPFTAAKRVLTAVGCLRNTDDCANLHNNIRRYGGFPALRPAPGQGTTG